MSVSTTERTDGLKETYKRTHARKNRTPAADGSYDSVEEIKMCLSCPLPACINCLDRVALERSPYKVPKRSLNIAIKRAQEMEARSG